jgi:hypothetical protein
MSALKTIRLTLTGPFEGTTKSFGVYNFVNGELIFTGNDQQVEGITKYFTRSYQTKVEEVDPNAAPEPEPDPEMVAVREDDSAVMSEEQAEKEEEELDEPNERQQEIITAVNQIEQENWVDKQSETPRPRVKDVQTIMDDPTVKAVEIVEVIQKWLS